MSQMDVAVAKYCICISLAMSMRPVGTGNPEVHLCIAISDSFRRAMIA